MSLSTKMKPLIVNTKKALRVGVIPDTHWTPADREGSLRVAEALGHYYNYMQPDILVHIGDANDFPSMCSYDLGTAAIEGARLREDIAFADECLAVLMKALGKWDKPLYMTTGNHAYRITRYENEHPSVKGAFGDDFEAFGKHGWTVLPFLHTLIINEVVMSHYVCNPASVMANPLGGQIETAIKNAGHSFVMGHVQTFKYGILPNAAGKFRCGLIAGACYTADHGYKGPQGNTHWRGTLMLENVSEGYFDVQTCGLKALLRDY